MHEYGAHRVHTTAQVVHVLLQLRQCFVLAAFSRLGFDIGFGILGFWIPSPMAANGMNLSNDGNLLRPGSWGWAKHFARQWT